MVVVEVPQTLEYRGGQLNAALVLEVENFTNWKKSQRKPEGQWTGDERKDFQNSPDDEEDTRSHEYLNDLEEEYQARSLLAKSKRFFKKGTQRFSSAKATDQTECYKCRKKELRPTKEFKAKYNKVKAKLALLSSRTLASNATAVKNKGLIAKAYEWDKEEVLSDDNEMVEVKVLMALSEENDAISKEGARNGKWVKISMRKVHTLLEMEDNDDRKTYIDYLC
ncbi:hypothetical protein Tco_0780065 [Tanacetum coccineum]